MANILFDLDGTLIDSTPVVLPAYRTVLTRLHREVPSDAVMQRTFGLPDTEIWRVLLPHATDKEREEAFAMTEDEIGEQLFHVDILLPHAREVLEVLNSRGHTLTTASNCGERYLDAVLDSQDIRQYFQTPLCLGSVAGTIKADILQRHFMRMDKSQAALVGDRKSDVDAAHAHGIPCIGCVLGFGEESELKEADHIIHSLAELPELFPKNASAVLLPHRGRQFADRLD